MTKNRPNLFHGKSPIFHGDICSANYRNGSYCSKQHFGRWAARDGIGSHRATIILAMAFSTLIIRLSEPMIAQQSHCQLSMQPEIVNAIVNLTCKHQMVSSSFQHQRFCLRQSRHSWNHILDGCRLSVLIWEPIKSHKLCIYFTLKWADIKLLAIFCTNDISTAIKWKKLIRINSAFINNSTAVH